MKTKDLIKRLAELDPSGKMNVILAIDSGEGYVELDKVFVDKPCMQPVDGDEIDPGSKADAIFLGDSHASKSPSPVFSGPDRGVIVEYGSLMDIVSSAAPKAEAKRFMGIFPPEQRILVTITNDGLSLGVFLNSVLESDLESRMMDPNRIQSNLSMLLSKHANVIKDVDDTKKMIKRI